MRRRGLINLLGAAALTLGGVASYFGATTRLKSNDTHIIRVDGDGNRKAIKPRTAGPTSVRFYRQSGHCTTERERRAVVRKIYTEGEARRKKAWKPDDRDDKYLHSHARSMRALKGLLDRNRAA